MAIEATVPGFLPVTARPRVTIQVDKHYIGLRIATT